MVQCGNYLHACGQENSNDAEFSFGWQVQSPNQRDWYGENYDIDDEVRDWLGVWEHLGIDAVILECCASCGPPVAEVSSPSEDDWEIDANSKHNNNGDHERYDNGKEVQPTVAEIKDAAIEE